MTLAEVSIAVPNVSQKTMQAFLLVCSPILLVAILIGGAGILAGLFAILGAVVSFVLFLGIHAPVFFLLALSSLGGLASFKGVCHATV